MTKSDPTLSYSDGRPSTIGIEAVNEVLRTVGVHVSQPPVPAEARPILEASKTRALSEDEQAELLAMFSLSRSDLLAHIQLAGRTPEVHDGGLNTSEHGVAPYPKVYDMQAMDKHGKHSAQVRFGRLHVNTTDDGVGIDELMTTVSGGPMTYFYRLPDSVVVRLSRPHGGFLDAEHGLIVAYAHGPEKFVMRYEDPSAKGAEALGTNPWIDFSGDAPRMLDDVTKH